MRLAVSVTAADIANGKVDCHDCPVTIATNRALREAGFGKECFAHFDPYRKILAVHCPERSVSHTGDLTAACDLAIQFDNWREPDEDKPLVDAPEPATFTVDLPGLEAPVVSG